MQKLRTRAHALLKKLPRWSLLEIGRTVLISILSLQILTGIILLVIAAVGRRRKHDKRFPHAQFDEVQVGQNRLQLYVYGQDLYNAMFEAIDAARECIYIESYLWKGDAIGREFQKRLGQKAAEGVKVYVIFDAFGNLVVPSSFKNSFHPAIHLMQYHTMKRPWYVFDPRRYALDHRKLMIVDGVIGFVGGYNIGSLYATEWRDTHLRIHGPAATELADSFIDFWNRFCPKRERITHRYPHHFDPLIRVAQNEAVRMSFPIRDMYIAAIDKAEHYILLTTAYFVPDHILLDALKAAAQRGVDVRVLVPWVSNHVLTDWVVHSYFEGCLRGGIRIFGYRYAMLHAKTCTIDGEWSTVGTANLDRLSLIGNYEINVEIYSKEFAEQMNALFALDTADMFELTLERWQQRPWYVKASERLLAPWRFMM